MNLDWGWIVIIGCILAAGGVSVWIWFRWDRLAELDRPEPLDPYGKLPPEVEKRRAPE